MRDEEGESARELTQKEEEGKREENFSPFLSDFFYQVTWNERRKKAYVRIGLAGNLGRGTARIRPLGRPPFFPGASVGLFFHLPPSTDFDCLGPFPIYLPGFFFLVTGGHGGWKGGGGGDSFYGRLNSLEAEGRRNPRRGATAQRERFFHFINSYFV